MKTCDVPLDLRPAWVLDLVRSSADSRMTYQSFRFQDEFYDFVVPHNSDARQADHDDWPPRFLFDVGYGCAAMKTWGLIEAATVKVRKEGTVRPKKTNQDSRRLGGVCRRTTARSKEADKSKTSATRQAKAGDGQVVDVFDMVIGLWEYDARKDLSRVRMMEKERKRESVQKWRQTVA